MQHPSQLDTAVRYLEALGGAVIATDPLGRIIYWNPGAERQFGWVQAEVMGHSILEVTPSFVSADRGAELFDRLRRGESWTGDFECQRRDGTRFVARVTDSPVFDDAGELVAVVGFSVDLSAEQDTLRTLAGAAQALAASPEFDAALHNLARWAVTTLADACATYALDGGSQLRAVGVAHSDPKMQPLAEGLFTARGWWCIEPSSETLLEGGEPVLVEELGMDDIVEASESSTRLLLEALRPRSAMFLPLHDRGETLGVLVLVTTERSGRRYTEADLALAREVADRAAQTLHNAKLYHQANEAISARNEMVAVVSHDLRSPLHTILTSCELLDMASAPPRASIGVAAIRRAAQRIDRLVRDLLDLERIDSGMLSLRCTPVDPRALLLEATALFATIAAERDVELDLVGDENPETVGADHDRLLQVFSNLLDNAIKFTPPGGRVTVNVRGTPEAVSIAIVDQGPGIAPEALPHLFERFWHGDAQASASGLGLTIANAIVRAHEGTLEVQSMPGRGSTFEVTLFRTGCCAEAEQRPTA